jgi:hypothetical protein
LGSRFTDPFYNSPQKIASIKPQPWRMIAAGAGHSMALAGKFLNFNRIYSTQFYRINLQLESGDLYAWGINDNGELGLRNSEEVNTPQRVDVSFLVDFVACGYYHTAIISNKGHLYTVGSNEYHQLGYNRDSSRKFTQVDLQNDRVDFVACGAGHTICVLSDGQVLSFGDGSKGQLGHGKEHQRVSQPKVIKTLNRLKVVRVSCGECHSVFVTNDGLLYACGDNRYGKLGLNQKQFTSIQFTPVCVDKYESLKVENISCGGCHMILIAKLNEKPRRLGTSTELRRSMNNSSTTRTRNDSDSDNDWKNKSYDRRNMSQDLRTSVNLMELHSKARKQQLTNRNNNDNSDNSVDSEMEQTFNRTHTLTRDQKSFVPLSETNLKKKIAEEEKMKQKYKSPFSGTSRRINEDSVASSSRGGRRSRRNSDSSSNDEPFNNNNNKNTTSSYKAFQYNRNNNNLKDLSTSQSDSNGDEPLKKPIDRQKSKFKRFFFT